jgi:hypothetical protein
MVCYGRHFLTNVSIDISSLSPTSVTHFHALKLLLLLFLPLLPPSLLLLLLLHKYQALSL